MNELWQEPKRGAMAMLVRGPAGAHIAPHSHAGVVQHYLLEAERESEGQTFAARTYSPLGQDVGVAPTANERGVTPPIICDPVSTA